MSTGSEPWLARRRAVPPASPAGAHLVHPCQLWRLHTCRSLWQSEAGPGSLTQTAGTGRRGPRAGSLLAVERWHQGPGGLPMQPSGLSNGPSACSTAGPSGQGPVLSLPSHPLRAGAGAGVGAEIGESLVELRHGTGPDFTSGGGSGLPGGPQWVLRTEAGAAGLGLEELVGAWWVWGAVGFTGLVAPSREGL